VRLTCCIERLLDLTWLDVRKNPPCTDDNRAFICYFFNALTLFDVKKGSVLRSFNTHWCNGRPEVKTTRWAARPSCRYHGAVTKPEVIVTSWYLLLQTSSLEKTACHFRSLSHRLDAANAAAGKSFCASTAASSSTGTDLPPPPAANDVNVNVNSNCVKVWARTVPLERPKTRSYVPAFCSDCSEQNAPMAPTIHCTYELSPNVLLQWRPLRMSPNVLHRQPQQIAQTV